MHNAPVLVAAQPPLRARDEREEMPVPISCCICTGPRAIPHLSQLVLTKNNGRDVRDGGSPSKAIKDYSHSGCGLQLQPHSLLSSRDRFRTMTNVLGDALAAGIIQHICEKDFAPKPPKVRTACLGKQGNTGHIRARDRHKESARLGK